MSLDHYTDQQLMDELLERRSQREAEDSGEGIPWCDECVHFKAWTRRGDPPENYNPCQQRNTMRLKIPGFGDDPHETGFYKRHCVDRKERPPPKPKPAVMPPEPPLDGRPGWHLK